MLINAMVNDEINRLNFQGKSNEELKDLFIKRNCLGVQSDIFVYRMFQTDFLLADIQGSMLSLSNVGPDSYGDLLENPLRDKEFTEGNDAFTLGFLENYYASCWTSDAVDVKWRWTDFLKGRPGVRVKVSLHKFMDRFMDLRDKFFMLHYYAVNVVYEDDQVIDALITDNNYATYLDSLGQRGALLAATLSDSLEHEKEVRMIYSYMPENEFVVNMVKIQDGICRVPFDWSNLIEEVLISSAVSDEVFNYVDSKLRDLGVACTIQRSQLTS